MSRREELEELLKEFFPLLQSVPEESASVKQSLEKWSQKEILGHLIDSGINNLRRFVLAGQQDDLVFDGYDQDHWVRFHNYNSRKWKEILSSFMEVNKLIVSSFESIPEQLIRRPTTSHNLNIIGFRKVQKGDAMTLDFFMEDYILHMKHHLSQIIQPTPSS